jgi:XTP/dITP diphosphohydrolase
MPQPTIVLGTANRKKAQELARLLVPAGFTVATLADFPEAAEIVEDGETFAANAALKAVGQARRLNQWVLGEDSGLTVDALGGAPGVWSARYSGPGATDHTNNQRLLKELSGVPLENRTARFVCHATLADPTGTVRAESEAACRGRILFEPRGSEGFGYDPLFEIVEYHRTFAQFGILVKSYLSHRARAVGRLIPKLFPLFDSV